jgi:hypothetical protein
MVELYVNGVRVDADDHMTWDEVRGMRDMLLARSDKYMISDRFSLLSEERQTELLAYRQTLRDLPQDYDTIDELEMPTELDWVAE